MTPVKAIRVGVGLLKTRHHCRQAINLKQRNIFSYLILQLLSKLKVVTFELTSEQLQIHNFIVLLPESL